MSSYGNGSAMVLQLRLIQFTHPHETNNRTKHEAMEIMRRVVKAELHEALKEPEDNKPGPGRGNKTSLHCNDVLFPQNERQGNSEAYTLRRLRRDRPDLADRVIADELSANAAAIEADSALLPKKCIVAVPPLDQPDPPFQPSRVRGS